MASSPACPRCGFVNSPGYQFCVNCGAPLGGTLGPAAAPGYLAPGPYPAIPAPTDYRRQEHVDRTKTGLLLLMIGALLGWLPYGISVIGLVMSAIGAILVILGRKAFGARHARFVIVAIVLFVAGILIAFASGIALAFSLLSTTLGTRPTTASLESAVNILLVGSILSAVVGGLAQVLFTYVIQDRIGRLLLFAGYGAQLVLQTAVFFLISPLIAGVISSALSGQTFDPAPVVALQAQISTYQIFAVVADLLFAGAYYLAWSRVNRGVLPEKPATLPPAGLAPPPALQAPPPTGPAPPLNPR